MSRTPENQKIVRKQRCAIYTRKSSEEGLEQEFNVSAERNLPRSAV